MDEGKIFPLDESPELNGESIQELFTFEEEKNGADKKDVGFAVPAFSAPSKTSPLESLKNSVNRVASERKKPEAAEEKKVVREKRESTLLAKCMPYIYDEEGVNYAEEKPDYTLESVEQIIESAERRADERIARMYNLKAAEVQRIGKKEEKAEPQKAVLLKRETSIKPTKTDKEPTVSAKLFEKAATPQISKTLFDDLTARRTDLVGEEKVTSVYSAQGGMQSQENTHTKAIPDLNPEAINDKRYEDILSRTRPVNVVDISSSSKTAQKAEKAEEPEEIFVDDFKGAKDIKRVGNMLKAAAFIAKIRLFATALIGVFAGTLLIDGVKGAFQSATLCILEAVALGLALVINGNIFVGFKDLLSKKKRCELPLAILETVAAVYFIFTIITAEYSTGIAILPIVSLVAYCFCEYKRAKAIFSNFKLVASRKSKKAVTLIDDPSVTNPMVRSLISGEVLAAGEREADEIEDFLKHSLRDTALSGRVGAITVVSLIAALFIGLAVGASSGVSLGFYAAMTVLCLFGSPTLFFADVMPFVSASEHLSRYRAALCSKDSAEKIEEINAVCISSKDIFPSGTIKLYNITPLSANELDETLIEAAAVSELIDSPLSPVFKKILSSDIVLPEADSVKYEDNLGISGWVGDDHILIGNRSLMIAHGVRVPALEVDKKMLRRGYFPVYVAINQRACALLAVGYTVDRATEKRLSKLLDYGVALLVDNCDPNITEQMLVDYFGFYPDLVKILDHSGAHRYKKATEHINKASAHGFHRGDSDSFLELILSSFRLKTAKNLLYVMHLLTAVALPTLFAVLMLGSSVGLVGAGLCLMGQLISLILTLTAYFLLKL